MRELDNADLDRMEEFLLETYGYDLPEDDTPWMEFRKHVLRTHDLIDAHGSCPLETAKKYNEARKQAREAVHAVKGTFTDEDEPHSEEKFQEVYCKVMTDEFYSAFITMRWQRVKQYKKQTGVLSKMLYQDYLEAQNVSSYVGNLK